jgi:hypothetical protein
MIKANATQSPPHIPTAWRSYSRWVGPAGLGLLGLLLLASLWGRGGELLLDFGRELYVFAQMAGGKVLYRDIDYRFGPLAPAVNALAMKLAGASVGTVLAGNVLVLVATAAVIYRLLVGISGRLTAGIAVAIFLTIFGLSIGTGIVQYNFLTPYNHDAIYGLPCCFAALIFVLRYAGAGKLRDVAGAAVCSGLCFLTKPEVFMACAAGVGCGLIAAAIGGRRRLTPLLAVVAGAFLTPIVVAFVAMGCCMPWRTALGGTLGGWQFVSPRVAQNPFYRECMGTDHLRANLLAMAGSAFAYAAFAIAAAGGAIALRSREKLPWGSGILLASVIAIILFFDQQHADLIWNNIDRGLPVAMAFAVLIFALRLPRIRRQPPDAAAALVGKFALAVVALVMLAKIFFFARTYHYGFVLAAPAGVMVVILLIDEIPRFLQSCGASPLFFRLAAIGLLLGIAAHRVAVTMAWAGLRTEAVQLKSGGTFPLSPPEIATIGVVELLNGPAVPPGATLAVFPDAAGLNFATGRASSVPFTVFNPFELEMTGEGTVLAALRHSPPDFIAIVQTDESELGAKTFGRDFALTIQAWIDQNYIPVASIGAQDPRWTWVRRITVLRNR